MMNIWLFACILCFLYFCILCLKKVDFCIIWLTGAVVFGSIWGYLRYRNLNPAGFKLPGFLTGSICILLAAGMISFVIVQIQIFSAMKMDETQKLDYIIVLGCQVKKTVPSKALRLRLEKAKAYLTEHPDTIAYLSGGQGDGEEISEAVCMYRYLSEKGIAGERLIQEEASTTTRENLIFCRKLIEKDSPLEKCRVGLVSNNFHLFRALQLARKMGYVHVTGLAARSDWKLQIHYLVREYFAILKEKIKGDI